MARHGRNPATPQPEDRDRCNIQNIDITMNPHNWLCPKQFLSAADSPPVLLLLSVFAIGHPAKFKTFQN